MQRNLGGIVGTAAKAGVGLAAAAAGFGAVGAAVGVKFNAKLEQAQVGFTTILGSADAAREHLKELTDFAEKTPFDVTGIIQVSQRLQAVGFSAEEVIPALTAIGDAVAGLGQGQDVLNRITLALGQMRTAGKVTANDMRQLTEAGIPAWEILAERIGKSIPEAMKLAEKGAISASVGIRALTEGMEQRFGGLMAAQAKTFSGAMENIRDSAQKVLGTAFKPLFDELRRGAVQVSEFMQSADFKQWAEDVAKSLAKIIGWLRTDLPVALTAGVIIWDRFKSGSVKAIKEIARVLREHMDEQIATTTILVGVLAARFTFMAASAVGAAVAAAAAWLTSVGPALGATFATIAVALGLINLAASRNIPVISKFARTMREGLNQVARDSIDLFKNIGVQMGLFQHQVEQADPAMSTLEQTMEGLGTSQGVLAQVVGKVSDALVKLKTTLVGTVTESDAVKEAVQGIQDALALARQELAQSHPVFSDYTSDLEAQMEALDGATTAAKKALPPITDLGGAASGAKQQIDDLTNSVRDFGRDLEDVEVDAMERVAEIVQERQTDIVNATRDAQDEQIRIVRDAARDRVDAERDALDRIRAIKTQLRDLDERMGISGGPGSRARRFHEDLVRRRKREDEDFQRSRERTEQRGQERIAGLERDLGRARTNEQKARIRERIAQAKDALARELADMRFNFDLRRRREDEDLKIREERLREDAKKRREELNKQIEDIKTNLATRRDLITAHEGQLLKDSANRLAITLSNIDEKTIAKLDELKLETTKRIETLKTDIITALQDAAAEGTIKFEGEIKGALDRAIAAVTNRAAAAAGGVAASVTVGTNTIRPLQAGGPVAAGHPYLVGERGPELFVPRGAGTVLPGGGVPGQIRIAVVLDRRVVGEAVWSYLKGRKLSGAVMGLA